MVAGSRGKAGAAILAARGALRAGAGLVTVFGPEAVERAAVASLPESDDAVAAGPEWRARIRGRPIAFEEPLRIRRGCRRPGALDGRRRRGRDSRRPARSDSLVCDADALNAFAGNPAAFSRRRAPTILTPHPGEAGRLLGISTAAVQKDRLGAATRLAKVSRSVVVLKGEGTLTATPAGACR